VKEVWIAFDGHDIGVFGDQPDGVEAFHLRQAEWLIVAQPFQRGLDDGLIRVGGWVEHGLRNFVWDGVLAEIAHSSSGFYRTMLHIMPFAVNRTFVWGNRGGFWSILFSAKGNKEQKFFAELFFKKATALLGNTV